MFKIGSLRLGQVSRRTKEQKAQASAGEEQPKDLVVFRGLDRASDFKAATSNAVSFFLEKGLPFAGLALAGLPGLAGGALLSGALKAQEEAHHSPLSKLTSAAKHAAKTGVAAGVLGLPGLAWAPLVRVLPALGATLGTGAALALDYATRKPDFHVDTSRLSEGFERKARPALAAIGKEESLELASKAFAFTPKSRQIRDALRCAQLADYCNQHLGPAATVALIHDLGRESTDVEKFASLKDDGFSPRSQKDGQVDGVAITRVDGLKNSHRTDAMALHREILLDGSVPQEGPLRDFLVGHELSHVRHKDSAATLAEKGVMESLRVASAIVGDPGVRASFADSYDKLAIASLAISRHQELRADREGFDFAKAQGHSNQEVLEAGRELWGDERGPDEYKSHPNGHTRNVALAQRATEA